ncbi:MAG: Fur family transcriptional regulator [Pikeienuella sp.]
MPQDDSENRLMAMEDGLRSAGIRLTRQRMALLQVLDEADDHPDANELHRRAQQVDASVSLATVYRTLSVLEDKGIVQRHAFQGAPARFETADTPHHDHIIDIESDEVVEFTSPEIERLQKEIARAHGYEVVSHRLELYCRKIDGARLSDETDTADD